MQIDILEVLAIQLKLLNGALKLKENKVASGASQIDAHV